MYLKVLFILNRHQLIKINHKAILFLENILFKGYTHLKEQAVFPYLIIVFLLL